jgi:hypothetical protein
VLAPWGLGHAVQELAGKPVVASPFGTEAGSRSLADAAAFAYATDPRQAEALLAARRVGFLVLTSPGQELVDLRGFAPAGAPAVFERQRSVWRGASVRFLTDRPALVMERLYFLGGVGSAELGLPALDGFALVHDGATAADGRPAFRLFMAVAGARLEISGAPPGEAVTVEVALGTVAGRRLDWRGQVTADQAGRAVVRLPYATGANGSTTASQVSVGAGAVRALVDVPGAAVLAGQAVPVRLPARPASGR